MPKQLVAKSLRLQALRFRVDGDGAVNGLEADLEVNYGNAAFRETVDLWAGLSSSQKMGVQNLYDAVVAKLNQDYLA